MTDDAAAATDAAAAPTLRALNRAVFPGDALAKVSDFKRVVLGGGILREGNQFLSTRVGMLRWDPGASHLWVDADQRRYIAAQGDHVIGVVTGTHADEYRVDIGCAAPAMLPVLAFDGATKRNRPHLAVGALVYARVVMANKDMDPEISCAAPPGVSSKDWVTRESIFGELMGGHIFACPKDMCRMLAADDEECPLLEALGDVSAFELAVGINGRVWINAQEASMMILAQQAILLCYTHPTSEHAHLVHELAAACQSHR
eukprot:scaffold251918_cov37-Tisochrysis_lutea.AAC.2